MPPTEARALRGSTRATPRILVVVAAVLLAARVLLGIFERVERAPRPDLVSWREPGTAAEAEARRDSKPLLYNFSAEWCVPCHTMQDEVFADSRVAGKINALYVPVRVVDRQREEGRNAPAVDTLQRMYRVQSFPTLVVSSPDGARHEMLQGYRGGTSTAQWLAVAPLKVMVGTEPGAPDRAPGR